MVVVQDGSGRVCMWGPRGEIYRYTHNISINQLFLEILVFCESLILNFDVVMCFNINNNAAVNDIASTVLLNMKGNAKLSSIIKKYTLPASFHSSPCLLPKPTVQFETGMTLLGLCRKKNSAPR